MMIINFKNYKTGKDALNLARKIERYLPEAKVAVPALDLREVASKTKLDVYAQHVSCFHKGKSTGFIIPEFVKHDGALGSLLNHSEHRIDLKMIKKTLKEANKIGLKIVLCAETLKEAKKFLRLKDKPHAIAFEDKYLIGSGKSITEYRQEDVRKFSRLFKKSKVIPICGAGVSNAEDVLASRELGCRGVLLASAIAKPSLIEAERLLKEMAKHI